MKYLTKEETGQSVIEKKKTVKNDIRVDKSKDYLYYENGEEFLEEEEIHKEDVVFNLDSLNDLNKTLHQELESMYKVTKVSEANLKEDQEYKKNSKEYYSFTYREYKDTEFDDYVSLVVLDFSYDASIGSTINKVKTYNVNKETGKLIMPEELLKIFNKNEEQVLAAITKRIDDTQVMDGDTSVILKDETLNAIKNTDYNSGIKGLSVSKNGKLTINFIVKSSKINYNDSVEIN